MKRRRRGKPRVQSLSAITFPFLLLFVGVTPLVGSSFIVSPQSPPLASFGNHSHRISRNVLTRVCVSSSDQYDDAATVMTGDGILDLGGSSDRRGWIRQTTLSAFTAMATITNPSPGICRTVSDLDDNDKDDITIHIPLKYIPSLSAYVLYFSVGGDRFGAIVDTGAPFLTVPSYCSETKYGCYHPENSKPSGLSDTYERFAGNEGMVEWRTASSFSFAPPNSPQATYASGLLTPNNDSITFGVLSESLMDGSGGVFFGLVKYTDDWIRPSLLRQTLVRSMVIDLRTQPQRPITDDTATSRTTLDGMLTLSSKYSLLENDTTGNAGDYIPLLRDLNSKYGDPVVHYTARAASLVVNGTPLGSTKASILQRDIPIYVIFDTGVSGMVVSNELLDERYRAARDRKERSLWGTVEVKFRTRQGETISLEATKPLTTPLGQVPWPKFKNAHLVVLGLAFLREHKMTIDIDAQRLWLET